jgi:uncharacterized phage protein (TIGR02218 family)
MSFDAFETADGSPAELVTFRNGSDAFYYANTVRSVVIGSNTYAPLTYERGPFTQSRDTDDSNINMKVPRDAAFVNLYGGVLTSNRTTVTFERFHRDDGATPELQVVWKGEIASLEHVDNDVNVLLTPLTRGNNLTPPDTFSAVCNAFLFASPGCNLDRTNFRHIGSVAAITADGLGITVNGLRTQAGVVDGLQGGPTGPLSSGELDVYWQGGYIQNAAGETRDIVEGNYQADTDRVRIIMPFRSIAVLETVSVFAGCDLALATCHKKFNNAINFQGFAYIPEVDPANTELPPGSRTSPSKFAGVQS